MHELVIIVAQYLIVIPVLAIIYALYALKGERKNFVFELIATVIITEILVKIATSIHSDPRPFISDGVHSYFRGSLDNGFPSGHTTYSAMLALVVFRHFKKLGAALYILAALIGTARVIAGVHHGQDVVGGLLIAALGAAIVSIGQKLFARKTLAKSKY